MSSLPSNSRRVLAIDPTPRGFGFAVLEGPSNLIDWGVKSVRNRKKAGTLVRTADLIRQYRPDVVVLEDCGVKSARRCRRIVLLIRSIQELAVSSGIKSRTFSRARIRNVFSLGGASTKYQIALAIAAQLPELAQRVPRYRMPWMSEDYRMAFFNAAALALTYFRAHLRFPRMSTDYSSNPQTNASVRTSAHLSH